MSTTTDKSTVEEIRERHQIAMFAFKHMAMPQSATDIGVLLAEVDGLKALYGAEMSMRKELQSQVSRLREERAGIKRVV